MSYLSKNLTPIFTVGDFTFGDLLQNEKYGGQIIALNNKTGELFSRQYRNYYKKTTKWDVLKEFVKELVPPEEEDNE